MSERAQTVAALMGVRAYGEREVLAFLRSALVALVEHHEARPPRAHGQLRPADLVAEDRRITIRGVEGLAAERAADLEALARIALALLSQGEPDRSGLDTLEAARVHALTRATLRWMLSAAGDSSATARGALRAVEQAVAETGAPRVFAPLIAPVGTALSARELREKLEKQREETDRKDSSALMKVTLLATLIAAGYLLMVFL